MREPCPNCGPTERTLDGRCKRCKRTAQAERRRKSPPPHPTEERRLAQNAAKRRAYAENAGERKRATAAARDWIKQHPEYNRLRYHRYRARLQGVEATLTVAEWHAILEAFGHRCAYCLRHGKMTQDHVVPVSRGGAHTAGNIVPACLSCNAKKGNRLIFVMLRAA